MPSRPDLPRHAVEELDRELARLGRGAGALRLRLGEALERFAVRGGQHACGFSSLSAYALERCERSGRWAIESRTVARRLAELPRLRSALSTGEISWSMAELLARHATAATEQELVARARRCTVRQMRAALKSDPQEVEDTDAEPLMRTLTVTVPTEEAWAFECTRLLVERLEGGKASVDDVLTAMLAEGEITLQNLVAAEARDGRERSEAHAARAAEWLRELARFRSEAERRCEPRIPRGGDPVVEGGAAETEATLEGWDPIALDRHVRALARELTGRELQLGSLALQLFGADGWRRLGYATAGQYARERVGVSYSALKSHMALARRALRAPAVREAVCEGRIGRAAALLVGRVATAKTLDAWLARAQERTVKHLHEEVKAAELISRISDCGVVEPPDDELMAAVEALESAVLSGQVYRGGLGTAVERAAGVSGAAGQMSAQEAGVSDAPGQMSAQEAGVSDGPGQMSAHPEAESESDQADGPTSAREQRQEPDQEANAAAPAPPTAGGTTLRLRVSDETYRTYRALEQDYLRRTACPVGFLGFLCLAVWDSWHAGLGTKVAYGDIYARDRYRCSSPVCTRGDVTPHHLRFRSHGGGDGADNVTALCVWCHLEGVHGGRIRALPPAPGVHWVLGERPILEVHNRRKREIAQAA